jgi:hypothetical protein
MRLIVSPTTPAEMSLCRGMFAECFPQGQIHFSCSLPPCGRHSCSLSALSTSRRFISFGTTVNLAPLDVNIEDSRPAGAPSVRDWHPDRMQWHWGNVGSFLAGLSTVVIALAAVRQGPAVVRAWINAKEAQAEAAREEAESIRLERQRHLSGWSGNGVETYEVTLVTEPAELDQAAHELASGKPTGYVILRVSENNEDNSERGRNLRQLVKSEGCIARPPTTGEKEALRTGLDAMSIPRSPLA